MYWTVVTGVCTVVNCGVCEHKGTEGCDVEGTKVFEEQTAAGDVNNGPLLNPTSPICCCGNWTWGCDVPICTCGICWVITVEIPGLICSCWTASHNE